MIRKLLLFLGALLFLGVSGILVSVWLWKARVDAVGLRADWRVLFWLRVWTLVYGVPWTMALAILKNEGASVARDGAYPLGDTTIGKGPAIGPGQVLRINVERLWTTAPAWIGWAVRSKEATDLQFVGQERKALWASVQVMREALVAAKGDVDQATRRYNGSGPRAEAYADRAETTRIALTQS